MKRLLIISLPILLAGFIYYVFFVPYMPEFEGSYYVDKDYGFSIRKFKDWTFNDHTSYYTDRGYTRIYRRLYMQSPNYDGYYTGGDIGVIVHHRGYSINFVLRKPLHSSLEEEMSTHTCTELIYETINSIDYLICNRNNRNYYAIAFVDADNVNDQALLSVNMGSGDRETKTFSVLYKFLSGVSFGLANRQ